LKPPIQSLNIAYLVHATEDFTKIQKEVDKVLGAHAMPTQERMVGHFGNEIVRAEIQVTGETAWAACRTLFSKMGAEQKKEIGDNLTQFLDEHSSMFLRFDKQALITGSLQLGSVDSLRVKIKPRKFSMKGSAVSFYADLLKGV
jgi:RNA binding exosome subunit